MIVKASVRWAGLSCARIGEILNVLALAGTALTVLVASSLIWPLTGLANELFSEVATFASSLVGAVLMLPAVTQLESR